MSVKNMIVLFDESGTPAISYDKRTDWFIGVGVAYQQSNEKSIFTKCEADFGLSNSKPLKNDRIGTSRVIRMANLLSGLPLSVYVSGVNTANPTLRNIIVKYESFGSKARKTFRKIRKRPIPQIIHSHVLDHCLFNLITGYFEEDGSDAAFAIFIDDWSIPENDIDISLELRAKSLYEKISPFCANFTKGKLVSIAPLELLNKDSVRKRFVDGVASTFNRAYLNPNSNKYSIEAVRVLKRCKRAQCGDATQNSIDIMQRVMNEAPGKGQQGHEADALTRAADAAQRSEQYCEVDSMHVHDAATPIDWNYFLTLDEDLTRLSRFIEFNQENFSCFSIECARILLASASEVDVVAKQICQKAIAGCKANTIIEYREVICSKYPKLPEFQVMIPRYGIKLTPWQRWSDVENPEWWRAYNKVKHERNAHFREASLSHPLNSTAGLFMLLLLLHRDLAESGRLSPNPILFRAGHPFEVDTMMWSAEERTFIYKFPNGG